jgi:Fic family protein
LEAVLSRKRDDYFTAIERSLGDIFAPDYDCTAWLEFFVSTMLADTMRLTGTLTDWHRMMEPFYASAEAIGLNFRQVDGLAYATQTGRISRGDYMEITHASPVTASRDLAELVKKGLLKAEGKTRNRIYIYEREEPQPEVAPAPEQARLPLEIAT